MHIFVRQIGQRDTTRPLRWQLSAWKGQYRGKPMFGVTLASVEHSPKFFNFSDPRWLPFCERLLAYLDGKFKLSTWGERGAKEQELWQEFVSLLDGSEKIFQSKGPCRGAYGTAESVVEAVQGYQSVHLDY